MRGAIISTFSLANGGSCGAAAAALSRSDIRLLNRRYVSSLSEGLDLWRQYGLRLQSANSSRSKGLGRVRATWLFRGNDKGMDANLERSETANEDILIFFFQLDLETRIQVTLVILYSFSFSFDYFKWQICLAIFFTYKIFIEDSYFFSYVCKACIISSGGLICTIAVFFF